MEEDQKHKEVLCDGEMPCGVLKALVSDFQFKLQVVVQDVERELHQVRRENAALLAATKADKDRSLVEGRLATAGLDRQGLLCSEDSRGKASATSGLIKPDAPLSVEACPSAIGRHESGHSTLSWGRMTWFQENKTVKDEVAQNAFRQYDVSDYYWTKGWFQRIATSHELEISTLAVVFVNAIWIAVDVDINGSKKNHEKPLFFQLVDYCFFAYFSFEIFVRFFAFRRKFDCIKDLWFDFDAVLLVLMILEEVIDRLPTAGLGFNTSFVRMFRLVKILKMARIVKILRHWPELLVFIKGVGIALRSVASSLLLMVFLVYMFAVIFRFLLVDSPVGDKYFSNTIMSMKWLILIATMPDAMDSVEEVGAQSVVYGILLVLFIGVASLTLLNMLVGVLCEVISGVSGIEREGVKIHMMKDQLLKIFPIFNLSVDANDVVLLSKDQFRRILVEPASARGMRAHGVDPIVLLDFIDYIFEELSLHTRQGDNCGISFTQLVDMMCSLGSANSATVKDVAVLRQALSRSFAEVQQTLLSQAKLLEHDRQLVAATTHRTQCLPMLEANGITSQSGLDSGTSVSSAGLANVATPFAKPLEKWAL